MTKKIILAVLVVALLIAVFAMVKWLTKDSVPAVEPTGTESETNDTQQTEEAEIPGVEDWDYDDETEATSETTVEESAEATDPTTETTNPDTTEETTQPDPETEETTAPAKPAPSQTAYEAYEAMSAAQQRDFMMSFETIEKFFDWYNNAKAEYDKAHPDIEIGDGKVDIGQKG